ncbi:hypothetical protein SLA2020_224030 [Shorea laevis]
MWRDQWLPDNDVLSNLHEDSSLPKDARVSSLIDQPACQWNLTKLQQVFSSDTIEKITHIPLSRQCRHDRLIWQHATNGRFTVKSPYRYAWDAVYGLNFNDFNDLMKLVWKAVWLMDTLPKIKHFLWKFIWEILPTRVALQGHRVEVDSSCCICEQAEESMHHFFFSCPWSARVWTSSCPFFNNSNIKADSYLDDFLNSFLALNSKERERVAVTLWSIWNNRNSCLFQHRCSQPRFTVTWISKYIKEYTTATAVDDQIKLPNAIASSDVWQPPGGDIVKINTDAAVPQHQNSVSLGVVL